MLHKICHLADELGVEIAVAKFKPLSTKEATLGIGRKFKDEEIEEYIERTSGAPAKETAKLKKDLKSRMAKKLAIK